MKNVLSFVQGNTISFSVFHEVDGKEYELKNGEVYRIKIKKNLGDEIPDVIHDSDSGKFNFEANLCYGKYYFEISLVSKDNEYVISPVTDMNGVQLNVLYVTERL